VSRLFTWLLNFVYLTLLCVSAPFILWTAARTGKYREGYGEKFLGLVPRREGSASCVWIHAVSVGEVNLLAKLLGQLRTAQPDSQFVISTTSRAGFELAQKKYSDLTVFYCPLDFSWAVRTAMRRVRPSLLILAELELWPNLILAAKEQGARVAIINGRMSDKSFPRYRRIRPFVASVLRRIDLIAAQDDESGVRFEVLGAPSRRVRVTGSLKYDGAETDRNNTHTRTLRQLAGLANDDIVLLAGSTQEPEEQIAIDAFRRLSADHPRLRLILVPRHPERFQEVAQLLSDSGLLWIRRTALDDDRATLTQRPILLVDTIGELGAWWGTADIAFVGGSFGARGGQNMIEPAAYGAAVSFGPQTRNFRDIVTALLAANAALVVGDGEQLEGFLQRCLEEPEFAAALGERAQRFVRSQLGATARTITQLESLFNHQRVTNRRSLAA
jgi:3-deoxy-D-manno-octulosonic-acid transferase